MAEATPARPRVLYVIQAEEYSGAETALLPLLRADTDPLVACPPGSATEAWLHSHGIPTTPLPFRPLRHSGGLRTTLASVPRGVASARDLRRLIRSHPSRPVVCAAALRPSMLAGLAGLGLGRAIVWTVTDLLPPRPLRSAVRLLARFGAARVVTHSQFVARDFAGRSRRLRELSVTISPGVPEPEPRTSASRPAPRAAVIGHVSPTKRTDLALEIAHIVRQRLPGFELDVIGQAQYRDEDFAFERELDRRVKDDAALRAAVRFRGHVPGAGAALERIALLLHCRPDEPFGMVLVEAMAAGLPVVAPAAGGPCEIVLDGETGLLYPPGNAEVAASHVVRLLSDPPLARRMGAAGRERARTRFSIEAQVAAFDILLSELAG